MSTVVYRDGRMACDTLMVNNGEPDAGIRKIGVTKRFLFGYVGRLGAMQAAFDWILDVESREDVVQYGPERLYRHFSKSKFSDEDSSILLGDATTCWTVTGDGYVNPHPRGWEALGSGGTVAMGAMQFGANAVEAVEVAVNLDVYTGGTVLKLSAEQIGGPIVRPGMIMC